MVLFFYQFCGSEEMKKIELLNIDARIKNASLLKLLLLKAWSLIVPGAFRKRLVVAAILKKLSGDKDNLDTELALCINEVIGANCGSSHGILKVVSVVWDKPVMREDVLSGSLLSSVLTDPNGLDIALNQQAKAIYALIDVKYLYGGFKEMQEDIKRTLKVAMTNRLVYC